MSSSFIQIKPIGTHQMGMFPWHNPLNLSSQDFSQARRRVSCNLFGRPEKGAINETYRQEEKKRIEQFKQRYVCLDSEEQPPQQHPTPRPTVLVATATNIAESRLSDLGTGGESLIEKELREHEMKLKQHKKTAANCNEKLAGDRIKSRSLKSEELTTTPVARTFVDSSKCASERPKPYARQQSSITDYYAQRKTVVCNNSRTAVSDVQSVAEEITGVLPHPQDEDAAVESTTTSSKNDSSSSTSQSPASSPQQCEQEPQQEKISLHTMTTDVSVKLA